MERISSYTITHGLLSSNIERPQIVKDLVVEIESRTKVQPSLAGTDVDNTITPAVAKNVIFQSDHFSLRGSANINPIFDSVLSVQKDLDYARKKKPSGRKQERRREKLPNHIRHDENAAIAIGTWKKRSKKQTEKGVSISIGN